ncbi:DUF3137 domain-containing protein [Pelagibius sp.]|uniref:DUF3137 domain-containing protein n=1 Tax=Pelagibius sp. TaxID=1931238 RepID=UPI002629794C|nr:DUF3137 domain-containing protein [Pelagibius sp.]
MTQDHSTVPADNQHGGEQSFAAFFAAEIAPGLPGVEAGRKELRQSAYTRAAGLAFVLALVVAITAAFTDAWPIGIVVAAIGAVGGAFWVSAPSRRHREAMRGLVIEPLQRFLGGLEYHRKPGERFDLDRFRRSGITAGFNRAKLEDLLIGRYRNTDYRMVEARLKQRRRSSGKSRQRTVFAGLLCEISVPQPFACTVLLVGDKGALGNRIVDWLRAKMTNLSAVETGQEAFEARYQVYSDRPEEARGLLQPALLDSLLAIADAAGRGAVNCAFMENRFLIAIPRRENLFEIGRLNRSLEHAEEDVRRLAVELTLPQRLIDYLHGDRPPLFPER